MQLGVKMASVSITGSIWESSWLLVFVPLCWFLSFLLPPTLCPEPAVRSCEHGS